MREVLRNDYGMIRSTVNPIPLSLTGVAVASFFGDESMEFSGEPETKGETNFALKFQIRTRSKKVQIFKIESGGADKVTVSHHCVQ